MSDDNTKAMQTDAVAIQDAIDEMLDEYRIRWGHDPHIMLQKHRKDKKTYNVIIVTPGKP